jgi:probable rRNA maturation factor
VIKKSNFSLPKKVISVNTKGLAKKVHLNKNQLENAINWAAFSIGYKKVNSKLNIVFTNDKTIAKFHADFLQDDSPTDVITFPMMEIDPFSNEFILGDLLISKETALREAKLRKIPIQKELILYAIHGFLHLNGFDDHSAKDRRKMFAKQNQILKKIFP